MSAPQIIMAALLALGFAIHVAKDGQLRIDRYSASVSALAVLIQVAILWWGGFWE